LLSKVLGFATPGLSKAPILTLPPKEARAVQAAYEKARVILEYGSGGSTALAAGMAGKVIFSVESDGHWAEGLREWFAANPPPAEKVVVHHVDVGPTRKWGIPSNTDHWQSFHTYPLSVWQLADFEHPDVVLVDGRFRAACFLQVLFAISRPVTLLFDDYAPRPGYHAVERFAKPVRMHGRMAEFHLTPMAMQNADLPFVLSQFAIVR
jgi:hypothetical protein